MVKPGRKVAGKLAGAGVAIGLVLVAIYGARRFNLGGQITEGFFGAGKLAGESILAPIRGLQAGTTGAFGQLLQGSAQIGANLGSYLDALAAGDFASLLDGSYLTKYGGPGGAPTNGQPPPGEIPVDPTQDKPIETPEKSGFTTVDRSTAFSFKDLLSRLSPQQNQSSILDQPIKFTTRPTTTLNLFGASGQDTSRTTISGRTVSDAFASVVKAFQQPTLVGSFSTPTGGERVIRATPELFERLRINLGG